VTGHSERASERGPAATVAVLLGWVGRTSRDRTAGDWLLSLMLTAGNRQWSGSAKLLGKKLSAAHARTAS